VQTQVVEVATPGKYLSIERGFLCVTEKQTEIARLALDDVAAVLVTTPGASLSTSLAVGLGERGIPLIICGRNFRPSALLWPLEQHHEQAGRFQAQIMLSKPQKKSIWRQIVRAKILNQHATLTSVNMSLPVLKRLASEVNVGDSQNIEAQAARYYWPALFGSTFRRDVDLEGRNAQLNYGYAVIRAMVARAVCAAGLHPSLGIFHSDPKNSFQLVDDLIEPFRPIMDFYVAGLSSEHEVSPVVKKRLASVAEHECEMSGERCVFAQAVHRYLRSYVEVLIGLTPKIEFPVLRLTSRDGQ
jgi:CRISPR-associated protein Cas1